MSHPINIIIEENKKEMEDEKKSLFEIFMDIDDLIFNSFTNLKIK